MRKLGTLAAGLLLVALATFTSTEAASASGEYIDVATHNIAHDGWGGLAYVARYDRPLMMMGQEVCAPALLDLMGEIGSFGYGQWSFAQVARATSCGNAALYTVAITVAPQAIHGSGYHPGSSSHGWACIRGSYGFTWRSCSTHKSEQLQPGASPELEPAPQRCSA